MLIFILFFYKNKNSKDGFCEKCKECRKNDPKIVNSLTNLQPLWANENIRKGKSI